MTVTNQETIFILSRKANVSINKFIPHRIF